MVRSLVAPLCLLWWAEPLSHARIIFAGRLLLASFAFVGNDSVSAENVKATDVTMEWGKDVLPKDKLSAVVMWGV
jgi:hypothetical protein